MDQNKNSRFIIDSKMAAEQLNNINVSKVYGMDVLGYDTLATQLKTDKIVKKKDINNNLNNLNNLNNTPIRSTLTSTSSSLTTSTTRNNDNNISNISNDNNTSSYPRYVTKRRPSNNDEQLSLSNNSSTNSTSNIGNNTNNINNTTKPIINPVGSYKSTLQASKTTSSSQIDSNSTSTSTPIPITTTATTSLYSKSRIHNTDNSKPQSTSLYGSARITNTSNNNNNNNNPNNDLMTSSLPPTPPTTTIINTASLYLKDRTTPSLISSRAQYMKSTNTNNTTTNNNTNNNIPNNNDSQKDELSENKTQEVISHNTSNRVSPTTTTAFETNSDTSNETIHNNEIKTNLPIPNQFIENTRIVENDSSNSIIKNANMIEESKFPKHNDNSIQKIIESQPISAESLPTKPISSTTLSSTLTTTTSSSKSVIMNSQTPKLLTTGTKPISLDFIQWARVQTTDSFIHRVNQDKIRLEKGLSTDGNTILHSVCEVGNLSLVQLLLSVYPPKVFMIKNNEGLNPFHLACKKGMLHIVMYLVNNKFVDIISKTNDDSTALHLATSGNHIEIITFLLQKFPKKEVWTKNIRGFTPLHVACMEGHVESMKLLASSPGANLKLPDKQGKGCLEIACILGHLSLARAILSLPLKLRPNINSTSGINNYTCLHWACANQQYSMIKFLVQDQDADCTIEDGNGMTPDMLVDDPIVNLLIQNGNMRENNCNGNKNDNQKENDENCEEEEEEEEEEKNEEEDNSKKRFGLFSSKFLSKTFSKSKTKLSTESKFTSKQKKKEESEEEEDEDEEEEDEEEEEEEEEEENEGDEEDEDDDEEEEEDNNENDEQEEEQSDNDNDNEEEEEENAEEIPSFDDNLLFEWILDETKLAELEEQLGLAPNILRDVTQIYYSSNEETLLHIGCKSDAPITMIQYLIEGLGSNINQQDKTGSTPLHYAVLSSNLSIVKYLVKYCGALLDIKDNKGLTVSDHCNRISSSNISEISKIIKKGLKKDPNERLKINIPEIILLDCE